MARSKTPKDSAKREAARERAEASRRRRAEAGRPPADIVDAAITEAVVRLLTEQGWRTVDGVTQIRMTVSATKIVIMTIRILRCERGYDQKQSAEALTARLRRPIRPRGLDDTPGQLEAL